ncbi:hypothetical protein ACFLXV_01810 [Chloroflexota bacterium]
MQVSFPSGSVNKDCEVTVQETTQEAEQLGTSEAAVPIGSVWEINVEESPDFSKPAVITLPYDESDIPPDATEDDIVALHLVNDGWVPIIGEIDTIGNLISVRTGSNGYWSVGAWLLDLFQSEEVKEDRELYEKGHSMMAEGRWSEAIKIFDILINSGATRSYVGMAYPCWYPEHPSPGNPDLDIVFRSYTTGDALPERAHLTAVIAVPDDGATFGTGENFAVTSDVTNTGNGIADNVSVSLTIDGNAQITYGTNPQYLGDLAPGDTQRASWLVYCTGIGDATVTVNPAGNDVSTGLPIPGQNIEQHSITVYTTGEVPPAAALEVTIQYPDRSPVPGSDITELVLYQDDWLFYDTVNPSSSSYTWDSLPLGHQYLVEAYVNDMFSCTTGWINIDYGGVISTTIVHPAIVFETSNAVVTQFRIPEDEDLHDAVEPALDLSITAALHFIMKQVPSTVISGLSASLLGGVFGFLLTAPDVVGSTPELNLTVAPDREGAEWVRSLRLTEGDVFYISTDFYRGDRVGFPVIIEVFSRDSGLFAELIYYYEINSPHVDGFWAGAWSGLQYNILLKEGFVLPSGTYDVRASYADHDYFSRVPVTVYTSGSFNGFCPIDLIITDPDGYVISKEKNEIEGATYVEEDFNGDGDLDDKVTILYPKPGEYNTAVIPEPDALPTDTYTLTATFGNKTALLAENTLVSDTPSEPYTIPSFPISVGYRDISLNEGWNLIGMPLIPDDSNIESVLDSIMDNVISVWGYDTSNPGAPWASWAPFWGGDLSEMINGKGYWINISANDTLRLEGFTGVLSTGDRDIILNQGWNLISLPNVPDDSSIETVLNEIIDNVVSVWCYDTSNPSNPWSSWAPGWGGDLTEMVEAKGYWINMSTADTLRVRGSTALIFD